VHPQVEQKVKFLLGGESWRVRVVNLAVLAYVLRTIKKIVNFLRKKVNPHPRRENPGYAYAGTLT